jgi:hypothetical protein
VSEEELGVLDRGGAPQGQCVEARGSLSLTVLTRRGLRVEEQSQPHGFFFFFFFFFKGGGFSFRFLTPVREFEFELDFFFSQLLCHINILNFILIKPLV